MPKVTHIHEDVSASKPHTLRSGKVVEMKALNGYEVMNIDDLAMDDTGRVRLMRIPYLRALASVKSIDGKPFGPIRTEIDAQKWAQTLSSGDMEDLVSEYGRRNADTPEQLKNE